MYCCSRALVVSWGTCVHSYMSRNLSTRSEESEITQQFVFNVIKLLKSGFF